MPRTLVRAPDHDRHCSLGWLGTAWMEFFVRHGPGDVQGQVVEHGEEYTGFIVDTYALSRTRLSNDRRLYSTGFLSRSKGTDKSGVGARFGSFEAFGPCRFGGWAEGGECYEDPWGFGFKYEYDAGEPMGKHVQSPFVRLCATEENQVGNTYRTIYYNLTDSDCPLSQIPGVDVGKDRVLLPWGGEIRVSTASAASKDGGLETFLIADESHLYNLPELREMYSTCKRNLLKRRGSAGTWSLETTTMYAPGEDSIAEQTYIEAELIREGRKRGRHTLMFDHRWGDCADAGDEDLLRAALVEAFGDAMAWQDLDGLVDEFWDSRSKEESSRRYFLNALTSKSDSWLRFEEWRDCGTAERTIPHGSLVFMGFDGSKRDDATALAIATKEGQVELIGLWEKPLDAGDEWFVDSVAVDAAVAKAMKDYNVAGFFADPPYWSDFLDKWAGEFGDKMQVKATRERPLHWATARPSAMVAALLRFHEAVLDKRISYAPEEKLIGEAAQLAIGLRRHALNAKRRPGRMGLTIAKDRPHSPSKIDAVMAAVLAYECAQQGVAGNVTARGDDWYVPRRLR